MCSQFCANALEAAACFFNVSLIDRNGNILVLYNAAGAHRFVQHHLIVFLTVMIQAVMRHGQKNILFKIRAVQAAVVYGNLCCCSGFQCVNQRRISLEHGFLICRMGYGIIDIRKLKGLGKLCFSNLKNAIRPDCLNRDYILH